MFKIWNDFIDCQFHTNVPIKYKTTQIMLQQVLMSSTHKELLVCEHKEFLVYEI